MLELAPLLVERGGKSALPPKGHGIKESLGGMSLMSTLACCKFSRAQQVVARDAGSRRDLQSGLAHALALVRVVSATTPVCAW